jgi:hypothetical protein
LRFSFWFCDHPPRTSSFDAGKKLAEFLECLGTSCRMRLKKEKRSAKLYVSSHLKKN